MRLRSKTLLATALSLSLAFCLHTAAIAQELRQPTAIVTIGDQTFNLGENLTFDTNVISLPEFSLIGLNGELVTVSATAVTDPFILFSFSATNPLPTAQTFGFFFDVPITPSPAGSTVNASLSESLSGPPSSTVTITPVGGSFIGDPLVNGVSAGIPIGPGETVSFGNSGGSATFGPFASSIVAGSTVNSLGINLLFTLSGFSSAGISGQVNVTPGSTVPEPGSMALAGTMALGGGGLLLSRRLRRRA